jgi:hypothetical protein
LIDLKNDEEFQQRTRLFRQWARKIANDSISNEEIADEVQTAIYEYEKYMRAMHVKYDKTFFEWCIAFPVDIIEDVIRLRISSALGKVLVVKQMKVNLSLDETKAPGRELSIVSKIKKMLP